MKSMRGILGVLRLLCATLVGVLLQVVMFCTEAGAGSLQILSPSDTEAVLAGPLTLMLQVSLDSGQQLQSISVRVDDVPVETRGIALSTGNKDLALHRVQLDLAAGNRTLQITAKTNTGEIPPSTLTLRIVAPGDVDPLLRPNLYVLAVGVSSYREPSLHLRFPAKDAIDFSAAMRRQSGGLYKSVKTRLLVDAAANKASLLDAMEWLQHQATNRDVVVLFLAGHGIRDSASGSYYFLPSDADLAAVKRTMVSQDDLRTTLHSLPGKVLVFLDTCFAGQMMRQQQRSPLELERFVSDLVSAENGVVVFASSSGKQTSQESADWRNGVFTRAVVEGLSGKAALPGRGTITLSMLDLYVSERVKQLTAGVQTPTLARPQSGQDFPVALLHPPAAALSAEGPVAPPQPRPVATPASPPVAIPVVAASPESTSKPPRPTVTSAPAEVLQVGAASATRPPAEQAVAPSAPPSAAPPAIPPAGPSPATPESLAQRPATSVQRELPRRQTVPPSKK